jgi:hypothetical protein
MRTPTMRRSTWEVIERACWLITQVVSCARLNQNGLRLSNQATPTTSPIKTASTRIAPPDASTTRKISEMSATG